MYKKTGYYIVYLKDNRELKVKASTARGFQNKYTGCKRHIINFGLDSSEYFSLYGASDDYYLGRKEDTKMLKNNRRSATRFVLLHELKHAIDLEKSGMDKYRTISKQQKEYSADKFALAYIKKF